MEHNTFSSTVPETEHVIGQAKQMQHRLDDFTGKLPSPGEVTSDDCTSLAAGLRALAKTLDRHSPALDPPACPQSQAGQRTWVYPGQMR